MGMYNMDVMAANCEKSSGGIIKRQTGLENGMENGTENGEVALTICFFFFLKMHLSVSLLLGKFNNA